MKVIILIMYICFANISTYAITFHVISFGKSIPLSEHLRNFPNTVTIAKVQVGLNNSLNIKVGPTGPM